MFFWLENTIFADCVLVCGHSTFSSVKKILHTTTTLVTLTENP